MRSDLYRILTRLVSGLLAFALVALPQQSAGASGTIRYAKPGGLTSGACRTWATACKLQRAISIAVPGDKVWVMKGTYKPTTTTDRTKSFHLKNGVALYGGFTGTETLLSQRIWEIYPSTLTGDIGAPSPTISDNSYHVVVGGTSSSPTNSTAVLDGFYITRGYANGSSWDSYGAGIFNQNSSPTLRNLVIDWNVAEAASGVAGGAGMANLASSPTLYNVTFEVNKGQATGLNSALGGAMFNGGGSNPAMTKVQFVTNAATTGGGIYNAGGSMPTVTNATFFNNHATRDGGGIYSYNSGPQLRLNNVTFKMNSAANGGGMANDTSSPVLKNATFYDNTATTSGGGIFNIDSGPALTNVTFNSNTAPVGDGLANSSSVTYVDDSIFWGDGTTEMAIDAFSIVTIDYSIIQGDCPVGATCPHPGYVYDGDPQLGALQHNGGFADTMALGAGSPALDAGNPATCTSVDERGVVRPQGPSCDMGAYEVNVKTFVSQAAYDGWVLESGENSNIGSGTPNTTATVFKVGDNAQNRQIRGFLSFNTSTMPDGATIVNAFLSADKYAIVGDANPFSTHGDLVADLRKPYFGTTHDLAASDFQAAASIPSTPSGIPAAVFLPFPSGNWYTAIFSSTALLYINKTGTTQFRLRFIGDDDNDLQADYISFYSGNAATASYRPKLIVYYNP